VVNKQGVGALLVGRAQAEHLFSVGERELFEVLAGQIASIVQNHHLYHLLSEREERLHTFIGRFVSTQEEELKMLALNLEENLTPLLVAARKNVQSYLEKARPAAGSTDLLQAEERLQLATHTARRLMNNLRPPNLEEFGLVAALRQYVRDFNQQTTENAATATATNPNVNRLTFRLEGTTIPRLSNGVEIALFRACQEAINNAYEHSNSSQIEVAVRITTHRNKPVHLQLQVSDTGKGFDVQKLKDGEPSQHLGLLAMQERVALVGGQCLLDSSLGHGTVVTINYDLAT